MQAVFRFAMSITRRKEVAEDLTSEAFLAQHREMASIDPSQLPAWLLTVVRNRARNLWRVPRQYPGCGQNHPPRVCVAALDVHDVARLRC